MTALISRNSEACYTEMSDEIVVLNPNDGTCYHYNTTAAELWQSLDTPKTITQLCEVLTQKYKNTIEHYQQDVISWVESTQKKGLLTINNHVDVV